MADGAERSTVAYLRRAKTGEELIVAVSFSEEKALPLRLSLPKGGRYRIVFSSGEGGGDAEYCTEGAENALSLALPPLSGVVLARRRDSVTL